MTNFLRKICSRAVMFLLAALITLPLQILAPFLASAIGVSTWIDGDMPQLVLGEKVPSASYGITPCYNTTWYYHSYTKPNGDPDTVGRQVPIDVCASKVGFGDVASNFIKPDTALAFRNLSGIHPNPYNDTFSYSVSTATTTKFAIFNSLASAGTFKKYAVYGGSTSRDEIAYGLNQVTDDMYLKYSDGTYVQRPQAINYSSDGTWMVAYIPGAGYVRINTLTHEVLVFAAGSLSFGQGYTNSIHMAITDDGNTVALSGMSSTNTFPQATEIFDLSGCTGEPRASTSVRLYPGCRSRSLQTDLATKHPGFVGIINMRFVSDGKAIRGTVQVRNGSTYEYYAATLAIAGYTVPSVSYLALGDSFSSGEGEMDDSHYLPETNTDNPKNQCHVSIRSYPYVAAEELGLSGGFHTVACSGAKYEPDYSDAQYKVEPTPAWLAGSKAQKEFLQDANPDIVTISMIGNDIDFSNKIKRCLMPDSCYALLNDRKTAAAEINSKFDKLVALYNDIKTTSGGAKVYVVGYPKLFDPTFGCNEVNVGLDVLEQIAANKLTRYLNATIKAAAANAGVAYIDVENAFSGHQLCDAGAKAMNGVTKKGTESFHPNSLGHQLLAQNLLAESDNFQLPMPAPNAAVHALATDSAEYVDFMDGADPGGVFSPATYSDFVDDSLYAGIKYVAHNSDHILAASSRFAAWLNSDPTYLGDVTTNQFGELSGEITIPEGIEPGYHTLHIYAKDVAGQDVDIYKIVFIGASENDYDGDGVPNDEEQCLIVQPAGIDQDRDGIDDACDPEITQPPADSTPPDVTGTPDRNANDNGWYNDNVTINWTATDPDPSSGAPTQPAATVADQEGLHTYTSDQSCDPLNNCATGSLELKIDKTAPELTYTLSPAPTTAGWNNSAVTVTFSCTDATSGVASCSDPQMVSGIDGVYVVSGEATDLAGNTNSVNVLVSLDNTAPTVTQSVSPAANAYGWHNTDVTVTSLCDDNLSGVLDCGPSITLSAEGANQVVESTARDNADNVATASTNISIDKTAPELGADEWSNNPKSILGTTTITIPATDNLSGIAEAEYYLGDTDPGKGNGATMQVRDGTISVNFNTDFPTGVYKVTIRAKDKAGNWSQPLTDYLVVYDPFGTRMTGKRTLIPSLANGDILPGLISATQEDKAKFGFNVRYDKDGKIHKNSDFQFKYETGTKCNKPAQAQNCHSFELDSTSIAWLTTQGQNNSTGIFQGTATLEVDGASSNVIFRLTGLDGEQLNATSEDHLSLKIYADGANPNTSTPIYQVSADVLRGNIKISTW